MADLKYFQGTLTLSDTPEDMNRMNYGLVDLVTGKFQSITDELERIYNSGTNMVRVSIRKFNDNHQLNRMGSLHRGIDKYGVEGWFINSFAFEQELDEYNRNGAIDMEIHIEDFIYENRNKYDNKNNIDGFTTVCRDIVTNTEDYDHDTSQK